MKFLDEPEIVIHAAEQDFDFHTRLSVSNVHKIPVNVLLWSRTACCPKTQEASFLTPDLI